MKILLNENELVLKDCIKFKDKLLGFMFKKNINYALRFRCRSIHTFFMKENIDVIITDGFTGNVFLKTIEGMGKLVKRNLTESIKKNFLTVLGSLGALPSIKRFAKTMDYKEYGGALFLGVKKPVVKAHGSSDEYLFYTTIKQAKNFVEAKAVDKMIAEFEK